MTWALRRQIIYILALVIFLSGLGYLIISPHLEKPPTCTDGKQNGDETGIDCGGSCPLACVSQVDNISVIWSRAFKVVPGRYNAVAYLENHNKNVAINKIKYRFRFADKNNVYIGKREGSAYIPPSGKFAIFEPAINVGYSIPVYVNFEFTEEPVWVTVPQNKIDQLKVSVSNIVLSGENTSPVLSAVVKNNSLFNIPDMDLIAILYDANHNAISTSRTYLQNVLGEESRSIGFTWPEPFYGKVVETEIIPMFNIFSVELK